MTTLSKCRLNYSSLDILGSQCSGKMLIYCAMMQPCVNLCLMSMVLCLVNQPHISGNVSSTRWPMWSLKNLNLNFYHDHCIRVLIDGDPPLCDQKGNAITGCLGNKYVILGRGPTCYKRGVNFTARGSVSQLSSGNVAMRSLQQLSALELNYRDKTGLSLSRFRLITMIKGKISNTPRQRRQTMKKN